MNRSIILKALLFIIKINSTEEYSLQLEEECKKHKTNSNDQDKLNEDFELEYDKKFEKLDVCRKVNCEIQSNDQNPFIKKYKPNFDFFINEDCVFELYFSKKIKCIGGYYLPILDETSYKIFMSELNRISNFLINFYRDYFILINITRLYKNVKHLTKQQCCDFKLKNKKIIEIANKFIELKRNNKYSLNDNHNFKSKEKFEFKDSLTDRIFYLIKSMTLKGIRNNFNNDSFMKDYFEQHVLLLRWNYSGGQKNCNTRID
ncbi:hypothetical protein A0H76_2767 [Hepatospora eriocheir]|uniref:Uncharacterized protein n=1 Tax=Hepatospora eriocheir TaxID=1081669 RepID=A0A1X0QEZ0_9MICR|nr:hypothetical protein A0H76_2767 [Hepatospora eriocheir]